MSGKGKKFNFFGLFRTKRQAVAHEKKGEFVIPTRGHKFAVVTRRKKR